MVWRPLALRLAASDGSCSMALSAAPFRRRFEPLRSRGQPGTGSLCRAMAPKRAEYRRRVPQTGEWWECRAVRACTACVEHEWLPESLRMFQAPGNSEANRQTRCLPRIVHREHTKDNARHVLSPSDEPASRDREKTREAPASAPHRPSFRSRSSHLQPAWAPGEKNSRIRGFMPDVNLPSPSLAQIGFF